MLGLSETNTIGYSRGDEGQVTEVVARSTRLRERLGPCLPQSAAARLPLVLAQGNGARDPCQALRPAQVSCLAAIPAGWGRPLCQVALQASQPRPRPEGRRLKG